jgi:hypothetical protein
MLSNILILKINKKSINEDYGFLGCDIMQACLWILHLGKIFSLHLQRRSK